MRMLEKIAREVCVMQGENPDVMTRVPNLLIPYFDWEKYIPHARAVIKAIKQPTPEMIRAGETYFKENYQDYFTSKVHFQEMIQAALTSPKPPGPPKPKAPVLRIVRCSDPTMWYAKKVGQTVPFDGVWMESGFRSREDAGYSNVVRFEDAVVTYE